MSGILTLELPLPPNGFAEYIVRRFWDKVRMGDGCWERGNRPYSRMWDGERSWLNHRFSWVLHNGAIPDGLVVCHRCDNGKCVRPDHLFVGTQKENIRDCHAKGRAASPVRGVSAMNAAKSYCKNGHPFTPENTYHYTRKNGRVRRMCVVCQKATAARYEKARPPRRKACHRAV